VTDEKLKIYQKEPKNQQTIHLKNFLDNLLISGMHHIVIFACPEA